MLSKDDENKYFQQMQEGMRLALEATHALGGKMTINYEPPAMENKGPGHFISNAKRAIEIYKDTIKGSTRTQIALRHGVNATEIKHFYCVPVQQAIEDELALPVYDEAPYQPSRVFEIGKRVYNSNLYQLRRHCEFLLTVIENANQKDFIKTVANYMSTTPRV